MHYKIFILFSAALLYSCVNDNEIDPSTILSARTVLVYMVAENNLYRNALQNIEEMQAYTEPVNGNLLVYLDAPSTSTDSVPHLFKIENDSIITIKKYRQQNSASGEVLQSVINDVTATFPATEYGLILWSHGTGWLPEGVFDTFKKTNVSKLRSFGLDNENEMNLIELEQSLPVNFEFIIFDACLMGGIEVAYQLRGKTNYLLASPTETLVVGFPYTQTVPLLFSQVVDYYEIAKTFIDYYESQTKDFLKSASLTVIDTRGLTALANLASQLVDNRAITISDKAYNLLPYEISEPVLYYDFFSFLKQLTDDETALNQLAKIYSETVVSYEHTDFFLSDLALTNTTGLNFFIFPFYDENLFSEYKQIDWYADTGFVVKN